MHSKPFRFPTEKLLDAPRASCTAFRIGAPFGRLPVALLPTLNLPDLGIDRRPSEPAVCDWGQALISDYALFWSYPRTYFCCNFSYFRTRVAQNGEIPCSKVAGRWRFYRPEVDQWMLKQRPTASGEE